MEAKGQNAGLIMIVWILCVIAIVGLVLAYIVAKA
jgi:hypothetical protein